jgi:hypothetical protein
MRRKPALLPVSAVATFLALATVSACSSSADRQPFTEASPAITQTPAQTPEQSAVPGQAPQSAPVSTEADAGAQPDAPDSCQRTPPSNACGLVPQCGCTLAETCDVIDGAGSVGCITAGKAAMGAPCVTSAGCVRGLTCVFGTCHAFCGNPGSACTAPQTNGCIQVKDQAAAALPNLTVCQVNCDLRDINGCGGTTAAGTGVCSVDATGATDCARGGPHTVGQACSPADDCGPGLVCAGTASAGTCKKWCRVGTNDCGGAIVCNGFQTKVLVKGVEHGACP